MGRQQKLIGGKNGDGQKFLVMNATMSNSKQSQKHHLIVSVACHSLCRSLKKRERPRHGSRRGARTRERTRRTIDELYECLGPSYFRRAFRMDLDSFRKICNILRPKLLQIMGKNYHTVPYIPNGPISIEARVGAAFRYFAGASALDIMSSFGISHTEVHESVSYVIDAINETEYFSLEYPSSHELQHEIAAGFREKSTVGFAVCAGAIDGILVWIHKPTDKDCDEIQCSSGKFYCGRKHKFGSNCQAVCHCRGKILDLSIKFPGSTSDCLAFEGSKLYQRLKHDNFLASGLCFLEIMHT